MLRIAFLLVSLAPMLGFGNLVPNQNTNVASPEPTTGSGVDTSDWTGHYVAPAGWAVSWDEHYWDDVTIIQSESRVDLSHRTTTPSDDTGWEEFQIRIYLSRADTMDECISDYTEFQEMTEEIESGSTDDTAWILFDTTGTLMHPGFIGCVEYKPNYYVAAYGGYSQFDWNAGYWKENWDTDKVMALATLDTIVVAVEEGTPAA